MRRLNAAQLDIIVDATFAECDTNKDGFIDIEEYKQVVAATPGILSNMTLDFKKLIEERIKAENAAAAAQ